MKKYAIYQTTNVANGKIYVGFHGVPADEAILEKTDVGSIFQDGYLGSGKLIRRAIKKYGESSFSQELLGVFDSKEEAEDFEFFLVDSEFVAREDNYNISTGGNVYVAYGEDNQFYGKTHTDEVKRQIGLVHSGNKYFSRARDFRVVVVSTGEEFLDFAELKKAGHATSKSKLYTGILEGEFLFLDEIRQEWAMEKLKHRMTKVERSEMLAEAARQRFTGVPKSEEHRRLIGEGNKRFIEENPERHYERMMKINKNPEKIRKMAEKHRGMKRSAEACKNISESLKGKPSHSKGRIMAFDPLSETKMVRYFDTEWNIPIGWERGNPHHRGKKGKMYFNGTEYKLFRDDEIVPDGWIRKGPPKTKKG